MTRVSSLLVASLSLFASAASATGFTDIGQDLVPSDSARVALEGSFRARAEALDNLDLDRGTTPSGQLLYPVPLSDPNGQVLTGADFRLRADIAAYAPGGWVAVKARINVLNAEAGSAPAGVPLASTSQQASLLTVERAWGEVLLPFGLIAAGRMGSQWGLGMLTNGGDCAQCDSGDSADRIALLTPLLGHIFAFAYDFDWSGPTMPNASGLRVVELDPTVNVHTVTVAMLRYHDDLALNRRRTAGKSTLEYGAYFSYRWQPNDIPALYLPTSVSVPINSAQVVERGYAATATDAWLRLTFPEARIEAEAAVLTVHIQQPSLIPGVLLNQPIDGVQWGGAVESDFGARTGSFGFGLDLGVASGDPSGSGFNAFPGINTAASQSGDIRGAATPSDASLDAFRFHPDYLVDRILFAEIIGTVTGAMYVRPHVRVRLLRLGPNDLEAQLAVIGSRALYASSTPGGNNALGIEIDPTLAYGGREGFNAVLEHALLLPLAGLDNPGQGLKAAPAQLIRLRLSYVF